VRVLLFTVGSEGDVQPFAALAGWLRAEGHDPVLAAPALYQGLATAASVVIWPFGVDQHFWASRMTSLEVRCPPRRYAR
jgi:UDP:flavonoid glycosyltransferase YjiC (YdhE family)